MLIIKLKLITFFALKIKYLNISGHNLSDQYFNSKINISKGIQINLTIINLWFLNIFIYEK